MPDIVPPPPDTAWGSNPTTREVIAPDGSIYMAGPNSRYNADPTQIPAVGALPPVRAEGQQAWTPPASPTPPSERMPDTSGFMQEALQRGMREDQAEAAATAATRFYAQRGYNRDIQNGMSNTEAWQKWAPLLFFQPRAGNISGAAAWLRAIRPPAQKPVVASGRAYMPGGANGQWQPVTPPAPQKTDNRVHFGANGEVIRVSKDGTIEQLRAPSGSAKAMTPEHAIAIRQKISSLQSSISQMDPTLDADAISRSRDLIRQYQSLLGQGQGGPASRSAPSEPRTPSKTIRLRMNAEGTDLVPVDESAAQ